MSRGYQCCQGWPGFWPGVVRIAYTDAFADAEGSVNEAMPRTQSTIELADVNGETQLTLRATYPSPADLQKVLDMGMEPGISETLDRLDEHLATIAASEV